MENGQGGNQATNVNETALDEQARNLRRALPSERELIRDTMKSMSAIPFCVQTFISSRIFLILTVSLLFLGYIVENQPEQQNQRAVTIINRVTNKLTGRDFKPDRPLDVPSQVEKLILQATSYENLCQCWIGWCAFW